MADLTDEVDPKALYAFKKDFLQLMRVAFWMDKEYAKNTIQLNAYLGKYKRLVQAFTKKYKGLSLRIGQTPETLATRLFLNHADLKGIFLIAGRIAGLKGIGANDFDAASAKDPAAVDKELKKVTGELYLSYSDSKGSGTIYLEYDKKEKKIEVHYDIRSILRDKTPELKLVAFFALKGETDPSLDVYTEALSFGFTDLLTEQEFKDRVDEFNPRFGE